MDLLLKNADFPSLPCKPRKKPSYFPLYWLFNKDPYRLLQSPIYLGSLSSPTNPLNDQGFLFLAHGSFSLWALRKRAREEALRSDTRGGRYKTDLIPIRSSLVAMR